MSSAGYSIERLNAGQRSAFNEISAPLASAAPHNDDTLQRLFFLQGTAGTGECLRAHAKQSAAYRKSGAYQLGNNDQQTLGEGH